MCLVNCILCCHYVVFHILKDFILHRINVCWYYLSHRAGCSLLSDKGCYLFCKNCWLLMIYRAAFCLMVRSSFVYLFISENQEALYLMRKPVLELTGGFWWLRQRCVERCVWTDSTSTAILHSANLCLSCSCCRAANLTGSRMLSVYLVTAGAISAGTPALVPPCTHERQWGRGVCGGGGWKGLRRTAPGTALIPAYAASAPADSSLFLLGPLFKFFLISLSFFFPSRVPPYQEG